LDFDSPEDYLKLDDYKVWTGLKECESSRDVMKDLEARRLLKCAYERILLVSDKEITKVISSARARADVEGQIAKRAKVPVEDVVIDVPTLPSVPYHNGGISQSMDIPMFRYSPSGRRRKVVLSEVSRIVGVLQTFTNLVRVYTKESVRRRVESSARKVLGETST